MTKEEWFQFVDANYPKFVWFIEKYTPKAKEKLDKLIAERSLSVFTMLNSIWFELPDNQFNIIENPDGWTEFLFLLENPPSI
jgi:hypothetical protein